MAKATILVPRTYMAESAKKLLTNSMYGKIEINEIKVIGTSSAVNEAIEAVENGADIIIARGLQAMYIKENTAIPVVEIILTGQELGLLVAKAKKVLGNPHPHIAFVGNVFSDMTHFEELFDIKLSLYKYHNVEEHVRVISQAVQSDVDIIIGGDLSNQHAAKCGIPSMFFYSTEESMREALRVAELTGYAMDNEKRYTAQMENLLDSYNNGLILIDNQRIILKTNHVVEDMLGKGEAELKGVNISFILPDIDMESINHVLDNTTAVYHTTLKLANGNVAIWTTPVKEGGAVIGASLVCYGKTDESRQSKLFIKNMHYNYLHAKATFSSISSASTKMKQVMDNAKLFALSDQPVLINGETGTEKELLAQAIHHCSMRSDGPFITLDCKLLNESEQAVQLFGISLENAEQKGLLEKSSFGTICLNNIHMLSLNNQYRLFKTLVTGTLGSSNIKPELTLDLRLIACTTENIEKAVDSGKFNSDLFYLLNALTLKIPPLRERPEDLQMQVKNAVTICADRHHRRITLTADALQALHEYDWPGNILQVQAFCERLVLSAPRQKVNSGVVRGLLHMLNGKTDEHLKTEAVDSNTKQQAAQIEILLEKHFGNRSKVAQELGISVTTLWRRMKKYGIIVE